MRSKTTKSKDDLSSSAYCSKSMSEIPQQQSICYEGESLGQLLRLFEREIESARRSNTTLPDKFWFKQQFSIGVNDVTRVLERMAAQTIAAAIASCPQQSSANSPSKEEASSVQLQAIFLASECNPRWLTRHLPSLALSRKVPVIFVKDKTGGSLRLGELVKLKTAIAIGVKARGNAINQLVEDILCGNIINQGMED